MDIRDNSLYSVIKQNAKYYPDRVAFKYEGSAITFLDFFHKVEQLSAGLTNLSLKKETHIALLADNHPDYLVICGACSKLNIILTLLNCRQSAAEQIAILNRISPDIIIYQEQYLDSAESIISEFPQVQAYIISGKTRDNNLKSLYSDQKTAAQPEANPEAPFIIIPTAAVDGVAKGAVLSQANILNAIHVMASAYGQDKLIKHLAFLPFYHILGLSGTLATFCLGGSNVIMEKFEADQAAQLIHQEKITYFGTFPPILENIVDASEAGQLDLSCLKMVYGIEGPVQIERIGEKFRCPFFVGFGQTETSGFVTTGAYADYPGTAGKVEMMNQVEIMAEDGALLPLGQEGEIVVKGPMVFQNYWNFPDETAYAFRYGWLHTGDLGKIETNGILQYLGRKPEKALIKTGGENVYPGEIEKTLNQHPEVAECVVFGIPDQAWGEAVCAAVLTKSGGEIPEQELSDHITKSLARYKKPKHWFFLKEFPVKDGKVDREQIKSICHNLD